MKKMLNEGNQIHNFISSSGSGTVIYFGSGSDFLTSYGSDSGSASQKVTVPVPVTVPQHWFYHNSDSRLLHLKSIDRFRYLFDEIGGFINILTEFCSSLREYLEPYFFALFSILIWTHFLKPIKVIAVRFMSVKNGAKTLYCRSNCRSIK